MVSQDMYPLRRALINTTVAKCLARACLELLVIPYAVIVPLKLNEYL